MSIEDLKQQMQERGLVKVKDECVKGYDCQFPNSFLLDEKGYERLSRLTGASVEEVKERLRSGFAMVWYSENIEEE